jgi:hypothetical protein
MGALCLLLALFCTWAVIYMVMAHGRRMKRYMAPQRIPAPPGRTSTALARQAQPATSQYTFDLTTGRFHKNW